MTLEDLPVPVEVWDKEGSSRLWNALSWSTNGAAVDLRKRHVAKMFLSYHASRLGAQFRDTGDVFVVVAKDFDIDQIIRSHYR